MPPMFVPFHCLILNCCQGSFSDLNVCHLDDFSICVICSSRTDFVLLSSLDDSDVCLLPCFCPLLP